MFIITCVEEEVIQSYRCVCPSVCLSERDNSRLLWTDIGEIFTLDIAVGTRKTAESCGSDPDHSQCPGYRSILDHWIAVLRDCFLCRCQNYWEIL